MSDEPALRVNLRLGSLTSAVAARTFEHSDVAANRVVRQDLTSHYTLLADELRNIVLTPAEALLCCELLGPPPRRDARRAPPHLILSLLDALVGGPATRPGVDCLALAEQVRCWGPGQRYAVADAVERWWLLRHHGLDPDAALAEVGLLDPHSTQQPGSQA